MRRKYFGQPCSVEGCERPAINKDMCAKCYNATWLASRPKAEKTEEQKARQREHTRRWREAHPEYAERKNALRRTPAARAKANARMKKWRERNPGRHQYPDLVTRRRLLREPCVYCGGTSAELDHITPITRGGTDDENNFAPACRRCNVKKNNRTLLEFLLVQKVS